MPTIRLATERDIEAIAALHVASWKSAYRGIVPDEVLDRLTTEARVRDWTEWLATPDARTFVASERRSLVGFARVIPIAPGVDGDPDTGAISHLYVAPDSQRTGVGGALLTRALDDIRERGFERAVLWVLEKNYRARAFYERAGFRLDGARPADLDLLGSDAPEVRYQLIVRERPRPR
jgi:ribosomal protein S18 acetylase RimI-like enzyme